MGGWGEEKRTEFNYRIPSWCQRIAYCCGNSHRPPHTLDLGVESLIAVISTVTLVFIANLEESAVKLAQVWLDKRRQSPQLTQASAKQSLRASPICFISALILLGLSVLLALSGLEAKEAGGECVAIVQLLSHILLFAILWTSAHQASLSFTIIANTSYFNEKKDTLVCFCSCIHEPHFSTLFACWLSSSCFLFSSLQLLFFSH